MDPISDMFTKIRNGQAVKRETVIVPHSKLKMKILEVFQKENLIKEANRKGKKNKKIIEIVLMYDKDGVGKIRDIEKISKLSKRVYAGAKDIKIQDSYLTIVSTPNGILTGKEARKAGVGGEIICKVLK